MPKRRIRAGYAAAGATVIMGTAGLAAAGVAAAGTAPGPAPAIPRLPAGARVTGPEPGQALMHVTIALRPADPGGLERRAVQAATPGSAAFRHFLRPGQVRDRFGPPPGAMAAVSSWLHGQHLATGPASGDGLLLPVSGPVARIEAAFRTTIDRVRLPGGRIAQVNRTAPEVPAGLRRQVSDVIGLDNLYLPEDSLGAGTVPGPRACRAARSTRHVYTAPWLARAYGFDPLYRQGDFGQHVTVGLFELADYSSSDITAYNRCYGISPRVRRAPVDGGTRVAADPAGTVEATADIEVVAAMAPQARILAYEGPVSGGFKSFVDTFGAIVQQDRAQVVSSSWGYCEPAIPAAALRVEAQLFQEMAVQGQSMMAAAGDAGSEGCLRLLGQIPSRVAYSLQVGDPASQPFVTGVGGTIITRFGSPPVESAWNQTPGGRGYPAPFNGRGGRPARYPGNLVGSGGISRLWWMPPWQAGFDRSGNASGRPCGAPRGTGCREVPDVSALAAGGTTRTRGYVIYGTAGGFHGAGWITAGGTSLATPLWAALTALADARAPSGRLGLLSPSLYAIDRADPRAFSDITAGTNDYLAADGHPANDTCRYGGLRGQPCYRAARGYDMATGLGSPQAPYLISDLLGESRGPGPA